jgi:hypothetical protein
LVLGVTAEPGLAGGDRRKSLPLWARIKVMPLYRYGATGLEAVDRTSLAAAQIRERQDLQRVLCAETVKIVLSGSALGLVR